MNQNTSCKFDIVLWGATSFVGQLITHHIYKRHGVGREVSWCIAGRNPSKLNKLKESLGPAAINLQIIVGDAHDRNFLKELAQQGKVVISSVGPFIKYGKELIEACAQTGTDYCDLTGEVPFVRQMMDTHQKAAESTGARIINCAGFDSIPSDLGVYMLNKQCQAQHGDNIESVEMQVTTMRGGLSGGTLASIMTLIELAQSEASIKSLYQNPYALCPLDRRQGIKQPQSTGVEYNSTRDIWRIPFPMSVINTKIVHASNALLNYPYSKKFTYREDILMPNRLKAIKRNLLTQCFFAGLMFKPTRQLMSRFILPKPGEGPSEEQQLNGKFIIDFFGISASGHSACGRLTGDRDPGYGSTAKMVAETALLLAQHLTKEAKPGGFWTPSSALGEPLMEALREHAGITFEPIHYP